jgi:hypothetical protein
MHEPLFVKLYIFVSIMENIFPSYLLLWAPPSIIIMWLCMLWHLLLNRCMVTSLPIVRHFVWGYSLAFKLLSSLVGWLVAYSSAWNHSCWSPFVGPTLIPILSGTISSPQFHCNIYGLRLAMKNKWRSCAIMQSTEVLILIASTLFIYPYFICKFVLDFVH